MAAQTEFTEAAFARYLAQHKLMGARCRACGALHLPPRALCPACYSGDMAWAELSGRGELLAFTIVHIAPTAMIEAGYGRDNPYCAGIVRLEEGPAISAQILPAGSAGEQGGVRPEQIVVGAPLQAAFVQRGQGEAQRTYLAFSGLQQVADE